MYVYVYIYFLERERNMLEIQSEKQGAERPSENKRGNTLHFIFFFSFALSFFYSTPNF